jgi:hypothetical protein
MCRTSARSARLAAITLLLLAGCGGDPADGEDPAATTPGAADRPQVRLELWVREAPDREPRRGHIVCPAGEVEPSEARGYGRERRSRLCPEARRLAGELARERRDDVACTQVYGGPQTARIQGAVGSHRIDRRLKRTDGCRIAEWSRASVLLP